MGYVKLHYGPRLRLDGRYPGKPNRGQPEPLPNARVHWLTSALTSPCRTPGVGHRPRTQVLEKVTCPTCLKFLNLSLRNLQQPPQGSPPGSVGLAVDPAQVREQTDHHHARSSFAGFPASASAGAGIFMMGDK